MSRDVLKSLLRQLKVYDHGLSSYNVGASDALRSAFETMGYTVLYRGSALCLFTRSDDFVISV